MASVEDRPDSPSRKRLKLTQEISETGPQLEETQLESREMASQKEKRCELKSGEEVAVEDMPFNIGFFNTFCDVKDFWCENEKDRVSNVNAEPQDDGDSKSDCANSISSLSSLQNWDNLCDEDNEGVGEGEGEEDEDEDEDDGEDDDGDKFFSAVSNMSLFTDYIGQQCKPMARFVNTICWVNHQKIQGVSPRVVFNKLTHDNIPIPKTINDHLLWNIIFSVLTEPPKRKRLSHVTTLNHVIELIKKCSKIIVLTGAGVSVSCGIPDFRSKDGIYARLAEDFPDLPDPHAMFDIHYFRHNPKPFFKFAKEIYPGQFKPSPCHRFIKMLERHKKLLRNYTQNIDTLEKVAGINNVVECHGSFSTASCTACGYKVTSDQIKDSIFQQRIPVCTKCTPEEGVQNVMKPDIVFFGEDLPDTFHDAMEKDREECDLLIVIGSSLKVRPVSLIPSFLPSGVPQILINRERLRHHSFDVELLGDSDVIVDHLCQVLGGDWQNEICWRDSPLVYSTDIPSESSTYCEPTIMNGSESGDDTITNEDAVESKMEGSETGEHLEQPVVQVKCQKIGKRHIQGEHSRNISLDSSRDSGIGESSHDGSPSNSINNTYNCIRKRRYIFPGAELKKKSFAIDT